MKGFGWSLIIGLVCISSSILGNNIIDSKPMTDVTQQNQNRTFSVDYSNNQFLMDGKPFRFISGSFHYFRALPETWQTKLRTMRAAGLNAVVTYVEWSLHNPRDDVYNWNGIGNLEEFVRLAEEEDLYVILRPGPYICAERDMGGFPYWLLHKHPTIQLRTADPRYLNEVKKWYQQLMPRMDRFLYGNGGPIIMVQVENEYGSFRTCDRIYQRWLRDETEKYVKGNAVLFTNDGPAQVTCGKIDNVLATLDFGASTSIDYYWSLLRRYQPNGPLVNAEYYPGWLTHWQESMQRVDTKSIIPSFEKMLQQNASVNFYMFFGGTNFGFTAGANDGGPGSYNVDVTSYDYDAPMDEAGDPTPKYYALRDVIGKYLPLPNISLPVKAPKMSLGSVVLRQSGNLLSTNGRNYLVSKKLVSRNPMSFEAFDQYSGFLLFETTLPRFERDPTLLHVNKLRDRASIYINRIWVGTLSRENNIYDLPIISGIGNTLQILVENQGRINYNIPNDFKGILGDVKFNGKTVHNWNISGYPLDDYGQIQRFIDSECNQTTVELTNQASVHSGPTFFHGTFLLNSTIYDTYLEPTGWGKGIAFVNGFNLGRYWPAVGPQITLYVPKEILKQGTNNITLLEVQQAPNNGTVILTDTPNLDGFLKG